MGYHLNRLDEPVFMAVSKPLLTEFGIHKRLESCAIELHWIRFLGTVSKILPGPKGCLKILPASSLITFHQNAVSGMPLNGKSTAGWKLNGCRALKNTLAELIMFTSIQCHLLLWFLGDTIGDHYWLPSGGRNILVVLAKRFQCSGIDFYSEVDCNNHQF